MNKDKIDVVKYKIEDFVETLFVYVWLASPYIFIIVSSLLWGYMLLAYRGVVEEPNLDFGGYILDSFELREYDE